MSFEEVAAILVQEHGLSIEAVGKLTRYQVRAIYFRKIRDEDGKLILGSAEKEEAPVSWEAQWRALGRNRCWPSWRIELWIAAERLRRQQQSKQKTVKRERKRRRK